jgi:integrase
MSRRATGEIVERTAADGRVYRALRFTVHGKRRHVSLGPVSAAEAEQALGHTIADVERGIWRPPRQVEAPADQEPLPTFHRYAEAWWLRHETQLAESTRLDYRWRLETHLLPFFGEHRLDRITFDEVERYIAEKLSEERALSPRSVNMTVTLLGAILEGAVERELIARNPARGKGRRVRERAPRRSSLETAEQIEALLDAAGALDRAASSARRHVERRVMLAVLVLAGLRIGELLALRWRDLDVDAGWLHIEESKTEAGTRSIKIRGALKRELIGLRVRRSHVAPDDLVFPTATGKQQSAENFRSRVLVAAVARANRDQAKRKLAPLPTGITPHSLRRTFASVLYALGEDPGVIMDEMGHTDPALALRVYRQAMRRGDDEKRKLRALVEGESWR